MSISSRQWQQYQYRCTKEANGLPNFDIFVKNNLERRVKSLPHVFIEDDPCEIACITFGYKNGALIRLLQQRGSAIGLGQFKKIAPIEDKIDKLLKTHATDL
jgi:hypothetical protein